MKRMLPFLLALITACGPHKTEHAGKTATNMQQEGKAEDCSDPAAMERISKAVSVQSVFEMTDQEAKEWLAADPKPMQGYQYYDLDTLYDKNCVISLVVNCEWMGPYPTGYNLHYNFDKRTGDSIGPAHIIGADKIQELVKRCDEMVQQEVVEGRKGLTVEDGLEDYDQMIEAYPPKFTVESLNDFYIKDSSITFVYHFAFPHVMLGLEPPGDITFSFSEIKPFVKKDGPLAFILSE